MEQLKTLLVTGSTGLIGSHLVKTLSDEKRYHVIGTVEDGSGFTDRYSCNEFLRTISNAELLKGKILPIDCVVNCAFSRSNDPKLLAGALDFTAELAYVLWRIGVEALINISSQGVSGMKC